MANNLCLYCNGICKYWNAKFCSRSHHMKYKYESINKLTIDQNLHETIEGTLFSDAGLELDQKNRSINPRYYFKQCTKYLEYVEYIAEFFNLKDKIKIVENKRKDGGKNNMDARFKTCTTIDLMPYYNRWYPNYGPKIIPLDFKITPTILLNSYLGDGWYYNRKCGNIEKYKHMNYRSPCQQFCTDSFTEEDIYNRFMKPLDDLGIKTSMTWHQYKPIKKYPRVNISAYSRQDFFNYIGVCPVECFKYKWGL